MGRTIKKRPGIYIRLDDDHMTILDGLSREKQISRQEVIRELLKKEFDRKMIKGIIEVVKE